MPSDHVRAVHSSTGFLSFFFFFYHHCFHCSPACLSARGADRDRQENVSNPFNLPLHFLSCPFVDSAHYFIMSPLPEVQVHTAVSKLNITLLVTLRWFLLFYTFTNVKGDGIFNRNRRLASVSDTHWIISPDMLSLQLSYHTNPPPSFHSTLHWYGRELQARTQKRDLHCPNNHTLEVQREMVEWKFKTWHTDHSD